MSCFHRVWGKILRNVENKPIIKGMLVYSVTWPIGSLVQQSVESKEIDISRIMKFCVYGSLYVAPGLYGWMKFSSFIWSKQSFSSILTKACVEQVTYGPFAICSFLFIMTLLEGGSVKGGIEEVKDKFLPIWKISIVVWPAVQCLNYSFIPEKNRVPFIGICSLVWTVFLTFVKYQNNENHKAIK